MKILVPYIISHGLILAIFNGLFVKLISQSLPAGTTVGVQYQTAMFAMACLGMGEVIGGFYVSAVVEYYGSQ